MIDYRIEPGQLHAHRYTVTLKIARPEAQVRLSLPVWIPGSYLVREFARHLMNLQAMQGSSPCTVTQEDKTTWLIDCSGRGALTVRYEVYANDTSVRAAYLDARRGFFNGTSVFLKVEGLEHALHRVQIAALPKTWAVATSLQAEKVDARGQGWYQAPDYDELVDHPVELGSFWRGRFTARGVPHELVVTGAADQADLNRLLDDTQKLCDAQLGFWHGRRKAPFDRYVFLLNVVEDGYGGLEHRNSTALICARKDVPRQGQATPSEAYTTLLGLISHEYFHTWNVKRLKPREFAPYDYTRENYTRMLWFFEGFTSYYDDQFLLRTRLVDAPTYLKLLSKPVMHVQATPGRQVQSVAQASFDAWTRYYRPDENTANATVSYYTKGSLVALALDLSLRLGPPRADNGLQPSLDGAMRRLWALQRPITEDDVAQALSDEATAPPRHAHDWAALLQAWVHGVDELPLPELLDTHGVSWTSKAGSLPQQWGVRLQDSPSGVKVLAVMNGSVGERLGLSAGDELIALDGWRVKRVDELAQWHRNGQTQTLLVNRDQRLLPLQLVPAPSDAATAAHSLVALTLKPAGAAGNAPPGAQDALKRRRAWLGA
ncbi:MAG: M61 family peptidase [Rubrivivax sp.]|nr:MAG: M61 family peptidase [Rubrivivax sp.]